jgi:hypothetical protein
MVHSNIFKAFEGIFHLGMVDTWWPNGYNSIRVRFENKKEVVFHYKNDLHWELETMDSFMDKMRERINYAKIKT